ncbi:hypothetical protein PIROE2DRAFT_12323, partial [Piromyces sp. E2]
ILSCPDTLIETHNCDDFAEPNANIYCIKNNFIYSLKEITSESCISKHEIKLSNTNNYYVIQIENTKVKEIDYVNTIINEAKDLPNLAIIKCEEKICQQVTGIIEDKDSNFFYIYMNENNPNPLWNPESKKGCSSNVGALATDTNNEVVFCLGENNSVSLKTMDISTEYLLMGPTSEISPFIIDNNMTIEIFNNSIIIDMSYS